MKSSSHDFEKFNELIQNGTIWYDAKTRSWVGKASDGVLVDFGCSKDGVANYLAHRPNPIDW